jgi:hypothetical protein
MAFDGVQGATYRRPMSKVAGALLWNRMAITFPPSTFTLDVDTGLTQVDRALSDPPLGNGLVASRVQVIPLAPVSNWAGMTHGEPFLDPITNTVHVVFTPGGAQPEPPYQVAPFNVLFWNPHTLVGPGEADPYDLAPRPPQ